MKPSEGTRPGAHARPPARPGATSARQPAGSLHTGARPAAFRSVAARPGAGGTAGAAPVARALGREPRWRELGKKWLPVAAIVAGLAILGWSLLGRTSDEERVRAQLQALADALEVKPSESSVVFRAARLKDRLSTLLAKEIVVQIPELDGQTTGRRAVVQLAAQAPTWYQNATIDVGGLSVTVDAKSRSALANGNVELKGLRHSGEAEVDRRLASLRLDEIDGDWLVVSVIVAAEADEEAPR